MKVGKVPTCVGPTVNGNYHKPVSAKWLEIDDEVKPKSKYYWGWYCPKCHLQLKEKGVR